MAAIVIDSPVGPLGLESDRRALTHVHLRAVSADGRGARSGTDPVLAQAAAELSAYFAGQLRAFTVPLAPMGTPFQLDVWRALRTIPFGETRSYSDLARQIDRPSAVRAVGAANGQNPLAIIVPCHRVIGRDGQLVGFGGGIAMKRFLLDLESRQRRLLDR